MKISLSHYKIVLGIALVISAIVVLAVIAQKPKTTEASARPGDEYQATSTAPSSAYGATVTASTRIKAGYGALGSVIILGANTGVVNIYNATTSNVLARTGQKATSTILIASIPASAAAGTYTFDAEVTDGIYLDLVSGNMPTSTITYR